MPVSVANDMADDERDPEQEKEKVGKPAWRYVMNLRHANTPVVSRATYRTSGANSTVRRFPIIRIGGGKVAAGERAGLHPEEAPVIGEMDGAGAVDLETDR